MSLQRMSELFSLVEEGNQEIWNVIQSELFGLGPVDYIIPLLERSTKNPEQFVKFIDYLIKTHQYHYNADLKRPGTDRAPTIYLKILSYLENHNPLVRGFALKFLQGIASNSLMRDTAPINSQNRNDWIKWGKECFIILENF